MIESPAAHPCASSYGHMRQLVPMNGSLCPCASTYGDMDNLKPCTATYAHVRQLMATVTTSGVESAAAHP